MSLIDICCNSYYFLLKDAFAIVTSLFLPDLFLFTKQQRSPVQTYLNG